MPETSATVPVAVGALLQYWRKARQLSQLALATQAQISSRHLCFVETGRANPSRDMVLLLADTLDVPLRERNALLLAAGFAPLYPSQSSTRPPSAPSGRRSTRSCASRSPSRPSS
jgi:transcriptional regulator with XRE-family HTH domain